MGALGFEPRSAGFHHMGSDPMRINESALQLVITGQQTRSQSFSITGAREDAVLPHTPRDQPYALRMRCCLFRRLIFFLRHFHLCLPRFFQARELRFIVNLLIYFHREPVVRYEAFVWMASSGGFEPPTTDLEGQCYIQAKPRAHGFNIPHVWIYHAVLLPPKLCYLYFFLSVNLNQIGFFRYHCSEHIFWDKCFKSYFESI